MNDINPTGAYDSGASEGSSAANARVEPPQHIGRYRIERVLGQGGFGLVYLAHDQALQRQVAIKTPWRKLISRKQEVAFYLEEARMVARLDHPNIVPVYDVGSTDDCPCFIVSKFIEGTTLAQTLKDLRPTPHEAAKLVATIAEALHYAHVMGLVHRDIKPGNILIDPYGEPHVVDLGLALREEDIGSGPRHAGTAAYMSPEQARGEGHRVDGRSDIFSLGVVFYELLTGRRAFRSESKTEPPEQITDYEPRPPRQYDDQIPKELERICFKAMAKRAADRYTTAKDLAADLREYLTEQAVSQMPTRIGPASGASSTAPATIPTSSVSGPASTSAASQASVSGGSALKIVPKGLRSFDAHDADFFLELLPGPRDRDGLPDSLRFWIRRIEERDADNTFAVGLIYGPSGCGKSSLVKAGLLPRLSERVIAVYVEATAGETETRLLNGLRKRCPNLPVQANLKDTLTALRRGQGLPAGAKVLIVLDQFEQWLHARREEQNTELVQALRQCDGGHLQCIVLVRDDFWMGVTRFMRELEIGLVEGQNSAAVDLFPIRHAEKVLAAFGQAFGALPESVRELSAEQKLFLKQAVEGLAEEGKIICVRLALFAEMMKSKAWTPASLREVGGAQGVGEVFLEETFSAATAPPQHRYHQRAARAVLKALLPDSGTDIKGTMRSSAELLDASGYANRPADFDDLLRILDSEVRLVTPTDPEGETGRLGDTETRRQGDRETGRLERMKEHEPLDENPSVSLSPCPPVSVSCYYQLTHDYLVRSLRDWLTRKQKESRRGRAELLLADRASIWSARPENRQLPSFLQWFGIHLLTQKKNWTDSQRKMMRQANRYHVVRSFAVIVAAALLGWGSYEGHGMLQAQRICDQLFVASTVEVPEIVQDMAPYRRWIDPRVRDVYVQAVATPDPRKQLHASLALLPVDPTQVNYLHTRMLSGEPHEVVVIRAALFDHRDALTGPLWTLLEHPARDPTQRFCAASALAYFEPINPRWEKVAPDVAAMLVSQNPFTIAQWTESLQPASAFLLPALAGFLEDEKRSFAERGLIAKVYGKYVAKRPDACHGLEHRCAERLEPKATLEAKLVHLKKQASCAAALLVMGRGDKVWPLLKHQADPTLRSFLLERLAATGVDPKLLIARLDHEPDVSVQRAILLSLADYGLGPLPQAERQNLLPRLEQLYKEHPDPGIHSAVDHLLRAWQADDRLGALESSLATEKIEGGRRWYVSRGGPTMMVVGIPGEVWLRTGKHQHQRRGDRRFAIAATEVTVKQYLDFRANHQWGDKIAPTPTCPVNMVSWYDAAEFCNWLSAKDGIPQDQWCYLPNEKGKFADGMTLAPNYWQRTGYRLPTEAEWLCACRGGADTDFFFGQSGELMNAYVWNAGNAMGISHPVGTRKPNDLGLFDMHGNAWEWTHDVYREQIPPPESKLRQDIQEDLEVKAKVDRVVIGGSWGNQSALQRPAYPIWYIPSYRSPVVGFRPARTLPVDSLEAASQRTLP